MTRLILIRHGQTRSNVHGLLDTAMPGAGLTDLGREQAGALPGRLAGQPIDRIIASPLARTLQTAGPLAEDRSLALGVDEGLREILAGDLELRADHESHLAYLGAVFAWAAGDLEAVMPGRPESGADFLGRYDRAVAAAVDGVDAVVCVSHGAAIRAWACARAENVHAGFGAERGLPNTGIVVLDREGEGPWRVDDWQDRRLPDADADADADPTGTPVA